MKSTQLTENLIQLTKWGLMNAFLVREDDGFTLVDTTTGAAEDLIAAATDAGAPIKRILLTHAHSDHTGSVDALLQRLGSDMDVMLAAPDVRILKNGAKAEGVNRGAWPKLKRTPDVLPEPGGLVGSLEVVASPGHTPGHTAFLDTRDQSMIAGDAFLAVGGLAVPSHPNPRFPLVWMGTSDRAQTLSSARALREREPALLTVGHGPATRDAKAAMDTAIAKAEAKGA